MNQKSILNRVYLPILCLIVALSAGFRIAAVLYDYNPRIGYFDGKGLINAASIIAVCGSILLFTYAFVGNKKEKLIATFTTPETYIPSVIIITALIFFATKTYGRIGYFDFSIPKGAAPAEILAQITSNLSIYVSAALVPLALLSAVYFILNTTVAQRYSVARAAFGICTVLFLALYASFLYFDTTLAINAPNKIVDQMAFIFSALFFLYEIRISLARECWHLYITFGFIAAALCAYSSIPSIILFFARGVVISHSIEENVLTLCIFIFIASRLVLASKLGADEKSEFVSAMRERAAERNRYITEKEDIERRAYIELYNRMSEIEELPEDVNENEFFGIADAQTADTEGTEVYEQFPAEDAEILYVSEAEVAEADNGAADGQITDATEEVAENTEAEEAPEVEGAQATDVMETADETEAVTESAEVKETPETTEN